MLNDLKDFEKFCKICRKQGITEVNFQGTAIKFGELPFKSNGQDDSDEIITDEPSIEELMFHAVGGARPA